MSALLFTVLGASLVGSLHCAGMCGPFVAFYAGSDRITAGQRRWLSHLAYNGGRLLTYVALGALAGGVGAAVDLAGSLGDLQRLAALIAGVVMVIWGVALLLPVLGVRLPWLGREGRLAGPFARALRRLEDRPPVLRALALGGLTVLLPCGWLYAFVVSAAGTGGALPGAAVMFAFWLGTVPVMLGLGLGVQRLSALLGQYLPALTATALIAIGLVALFGRATMVPHAHHHRAAVLAPSQDHGGAHADHGR